MKQYLDEQFVTVSELLKANFQRSLSVQFLNQFISFQEKLTAEGQSPATYLL